MDVKESAAKADPVARAVAAIRTAQNRLVSLLVSKEDPVSRKAAAALQAQDPPPIWPLTEALLKAQDAGFRLRLIQVLAAIGPAEPIRVVVALGEAVKAEKDMTIKHAILNAMVEVGTGLQQACGELDRGDRPGTRSAASQRDQAPPDPGPGGRGGRARTAWTRPSEDRSTATSRSPVGHCQGEGGASTPRSKSRPWPVERYREARHHALEGRRPQPDRHAWGPNPDRQTQNRGPFGVIPPAARRLLCEHLPGLAAMHDKFTILPAGSATTSRTRSSRRLTWRPNPGSTGR